MTLSATEPSVDITNNLKNREIEYNESQNYRTVNRRELHEVVLFTDLWVSKCCVFLFLRNKQKKKVKKKEKKRTLWDKDSQYRVPIIIQSWDSTGIVRLH